MEKIQIPGEIWIGDVEDKFKRVLKQKKKGNEGGDFSGFVLPRLCSQRMIKIEGSNFPFLRRLCSHALKLIVPTRVYFSVVVYSLSFARVVGNKSG